MYAHKFSRLNKSSHDSDINIHAFLLVSIPESISTLCSVKAKGGYLVPPVFEVTICDLKKNSFWDNKNIKSFGKRLIFRFTAWVKTFVSIP